MHFLAVKSLPVLIFLLISDIFASVQYSLRSNPYEAYVRALSALADHVRDVIDSRLGLTLQDNPRYTVNSKFYGFR